MTQGKKSAVYIIKSYFVSYNITGTQKRTGIDFGKKVSLHICSYVACIADSSVQQREGHQER